MSIKKSEKANQECRPLGIIRLRKACRICGIGPGPWVKEALAPGSKKSWPLGQRSPGPLVKEALAPGSKK